MFLSNVNTAYADTVYGLEVKSFVSQREYRQGLQQATRYGRQLGHAEMWQILFVEGVDEQNRQRYEADYTDVDTGVVVHPILVATGSKTACPENKPGAPSS